MLLSDNRLQMRRSSEATSDGQMDHGQVRKPRISRQKPVTWPDTGIWPSDHLTRYVFVGRGGSNLVTLCCGTVSRPCHAVPTRAVARSGDRATTGHSPSLPIWHVSWRGGRRGSWGGMVA